jgi:cell division protein FtsX
LGAADRFSTRVERGARQALDYYEMNRVTAQLQRNPLSRRLILTGPADDFQHSELVRVLDQLPGVSSVSWSPGRGGIPLIAEGALLAIVGFLVGLLLAYLVELRRRYNAQWKW